MEIAGAQVVQGVGKAENDALALAAILAFPTSWPHVPIVNANPMAHHPPRRLLGVARHSPRAALPTRRAIASAERTNIAPVMETVTHLPNARGRMAPRAGISSQALALDADVSLQALPAHLQAAALHRVQVRIQFPL